MSCCFMLWCACGMPCGVTLCDVLCCVIYVVLSFCPLCNAMLCSAVEAVQCGMVYCVLCCVVFVLGIIV